MKNDDEDLLEMDAEDRRNAIRKKMGIENQTKDIAKRKSIKKIKAVESIEDLKDIRDGKVELIK